MLLALSFGHGLSSCRSTNRSHDSEVFYVNTAIDPATIKAKTCIRFEKKPDCILRLKGYVADEPIPSLASEESTELLVSEFNSMIKAAVSHDEKIALKLQMDDTVRRLKLMAAGVKDLMKDGEARSITYYTGDGYAVMNRALRGDTASWDSTKNIIYAAASGLNKLAEKTFDGEVYRTESASKDQLERLLNTYRVGNIILEETFLSTSHNSQYRFSNPTANKIYLSYKIRSKTGVKIRVLSLNQPEDEVLFMPGTAFRIISVEQRKRTSTGFFDGSAVTGEQTLFDSLEIQLEEVDSI
jgi:hypothetical protein